MGSFLTLNFGNVIEIRSGFIYDFGIYTAPYKFNSNWWSPILPWGIGQSSATTIDTIYKFKAIRVPITLGFSFLRKKKINLFFNIGLQSIFPITNGKIGKSVDYTYQPNSAVFFSAGTKYQLNKKTFFRLEICHFRFKELAYGNHYVGYPRFGSSSWTISGLNSRMSMAMIISVSHNFFSFSKHKLK